MRGFRVRADYDDNGLDLMEKWQSGLQTLGLQVTDVTPPQADVTYYEFEVFDPKEDALRDILTLVSANTSPVLERIRDIAQKALETT